MPTFLDIHRGMDGISKEACEEAHQKDLAIQDKHGVDFKKYWYSEKEGAVFCLADAPNKESVNAAHKEAHGGEPSEVIEVEEGA